MISPADWHERNTAFLSNGVGWVRARLEALAAENVAAMPSKKVAPRGDYNDQPALIQLAERLHLSEFEQDVLLLCAATALDASLPALCARASHDPAKPYPTFSLAIRLFPNAEWEALTPSSALRRWRLIEIHQTASEPLIVSALGLDERIVHYLKGLTLVDDRVESWIQPLQPAPAGTSPPSLMILCDRIEGAWRSEQDIAGRSFIQLLGPNSETKKEVAIELARRLRCTLWRLSAATIAALGAEWEAFVRLLAREALLLDAIMYVDCDGADGIAEPSLFASLIRLLERLEPMPVVVASRDPLSGLDRPTLHEFVSRPTATEQRDAWVRLLGSKREDVANALAGQFNLDISTIERVGELAQTRGTSPAAIASDLWRSARDLVRPRVIGLADRIDCRATWKDLVLPTEQTQLLRQLAQQVPQRWIVYERWGFGQRLTRGLGIGALFFGESGTGKTMAAEVIAKEIDLDLYRIDLASVVSKYIGETEKNLRRVFDAFEDGGAILFFDEADALFGKRSEVKDSHDRYANIEVNYLLQRMEAYRGLVILATNRKSALDQAFTRRLRFIINFPYPAEAERSEIWRRVFPPETPIDTFDPWRLARLGLSGGNIQSVALNAAFRAASEKRNVDMKLIFACARAELIKLGQPINEADFLLEQDQHHQRRRA